MGIFRKFLGKTNIAFIRVIYLYYREQHSLLKTLFFFIKGIFQLYIPSKKKCKGGQLRALFNKAEIKIDPSSRFVYTIDPFKIIYRENRIIDNLSIDYAKIINSSLYNWKNEIESLDASAYKNNQIELLLGIEEYIERICSKLEKSKHPEKKKLITYFQNIKTTSASTLEEGLQRILFFNQLVWQNGLSLNGIGRLDKILDQIYQNELKKNKNLKKESKEILKDFLLILHKDYWFKSNSLLGDTGQIIVLGGKEENGKYFTNDLTYTMIELMSELNLPDPKILLRVASNTPRDLIALSLKCIQTGIGCPLLSNDDVIIPKLIAFGYDKKDAYNYATSACWEPFIPGKSFDQNNIDSFVYMEPLEKLLENENLELIKDFKQLKNFYKNYLKNYLEEYLKEIELIRWEESPLLSLFTDNCLKKQKDISSGGAKYNHYGFTSVSLNNVVNSLYNIKYFVFDLKKYTLEELNEMRKSNYVNYDETLSELKTQSKRYGTDQKEIVDLTNEITVCVDEFFSDKKNPLGGKIKFGLSSPMYITKSKNIKASFDGRTDNEAFGVHISTDKAGVAYTEILQFSSKLDYTNHRFNGNVTDFMINPSFIEKNFQKMIDFILLSISLGFFQMQMNVISSDILIKAKNNPENYQNLIVRVWGFSAYFNDLPDSYKDLLIERALKNEGKSF